MTLWRQRRSKHANYIPQWYISGDSDRSTITDWGHALQRITTKHFYTKYDMGFTYYAPVYAYEWVFEKLLHLNDLRLFSGNQVYISCKHGQSPIKRYRREDYTYDLWTYMDFDRYGYGYITQEWMKRASRVAWQDMPNPRSIWLPLKWLVNATWEWTEHGLWISCPAC